MTFHRAADAISHVNPAASAAHCKNDDFGLSCLYVERDNEGLLVTGKSGPTSSSAIRIDGGDAAFDARFIRK